MAKAARALSAPRRRRNSTIPHNPHSRVRGLVGDEDDDAVMLTPPLRVERGRVSGRDT
jgi:hypothetical protein